MITQKCSHGTCTREIRLVAILGSYGDVERWFIKERLDPDLFFVADRGDTRYVGHHAAWSDHIAEKYDEVIDLGTFDERNRK